MNDNVGNKDLRKDGVDRPKKEDNAIRDGNVTRDNNITRDDNVDVVDDGCPAHLVRIPYQMKETGPLLPNVIHLNKPEITIGRLSCD